MARFGDFLEVGTVALILSPVIRQVRDQSLYR